jgi:hypothetical protein
MHGEYNVKFSLEQLFVKCARGVRFVSRGLSPLRFTISDIMSTESIDKVCMMFEQAVGVLSIEILYIFVSE